MAFEEYRNDLEQYTEGIGLAWRAFVNNMTSSMRRDAVVMDGSMSTFALYWAGSGERDDQSLAWGQEGPNLFVLLGKAHRAFSTVAVDCWKKCDR